MPSKLKRNLKEEVGSSAMAQLLDANQALLKTPQVGDLVKGKVISASKKEVHLDIEGWGTGIIRGRELYQESDDYTDLQVGDEIEATVMELESENGELELSFRFAGHKKVWDILKAMMQSGQIVSADVLDANRGGLMVKINRIAGFLPVSQLSPEHYPRVPGGDKTKILEKLKSYAHEKMDVKVITADEDGEKLIVSEKAAWEEQQHGTITKYQPGDLVEGKVTAVTDFGAFVKFGENLEGLIHISELAWQRIDDPKDYIKVGQEIKAKIINVDGSKIFLSTKALQEDPWVHVKDKYQVGQIVSGKILKANPFGLFVELDPEIHGLAHISELGKKAVENIAEIAKPGDTMEFKIISVEPENHRLGLSLKTKGGNTADASEDKPVKEKKAKKAKKEKAALPAQAGEPETAEVPTEAEVKE
ncbi:MAG: S1 RNA-binding domain-containing protein [Patescibacteria group bacterium]|jgi:small subunit ribosomal protein S1